MERSMGEEILQISVEGQPVGIVGLEEIFSRTKDQQSLGEGEIKRFLLDEAKKKNFIPAKMEEKYVRALLKAFKKYCGEEVDEGSSGLQVRILGGGCMNCQKL